MMEFLPVDIREGLERAQRRASPRSRRLAVHLGNAAYPILRFWEDGFAIDAATIQRLRGFVEIHEGPRQILSCLIQATDVQDGELICTFKWIAPVRDRAALDYEVDEDVPMLLLSQH